MTAGKRQILFVCTGNLCRSPMAEYIFRHRMGDDGRWEAQSAGVFAITGSRASSQAVDVLHEWKVDLRPHRSQPLTEDLVRQSELVVVMTTGHQREVLAQFPQAAEKVHLLTSFGTDSDSPDIADPIGLSVHVYRTIRDQIDSAMADLILHLMDRSSPRGK
jgi:protein-tyrosine-phosphatase